MKKIPQRTCIGCKEKKEKRELIRIVKDKEGNMTLDRTGRSNGRGAYICDNIQCLEKAIKTKALARTFEMEIEETVYNELRGVISEK